MISGRKKNILNVGTNIQYYNFGNTGNVTMYTVPSGFKLVLNHVSLAVGCSGVTGALVTIQNAGGTNICQLLGAYGFTGVALSSEIVVKSDEKLILANINSNWACGFSGQLIENNEEI